ncbi:MAG: outer membrane protein assembly factor BamD [Candidatus Omnitrophica bacterium]|nr:outer membrane protein assembly factor BamD [Candidatus Omnitrophota bacterium]
MKIRTILLLLLSISLILPQNSWAYWVWSPEAGKFVNPEGTTQDEANEKFDFAMQLYKEKSLDEAFDQFRDLIKKHPASKMAPEAQYRIGIIFEEKSDYKKAFQAYKTIVESYPQSDRVNEVIEREFRIGNLFFSGKKAKLMGLEILPSLPRAVEVFQHIVKSAPYSEWGDKSQFHLGLAYKKWGHYKEAMEAFQTLVEQYPKSILIPEARYQLTETAFLQSSAAHRDQRALEEASTQVDSFLERYPDAGVSEKALKIRQEIDEKNSEKNYRIGLYYEKENFLSSALIYYADVARLYPHTQWGKKAAEKLKSLKEPATYLTEQSKELDQQIKILEAKLTGLEETTSDIEKDRLKRELKRLEERQKALEKNKSQSMNRREEDLKRRQRELKDKYKKLETKKKLLKKNPSEDLKNAIDRWQASLDQEADDLRNEKTQVKEWRSDLGLKDRTSYWDILPFVGEPGSALERVRRVEAKKLYKVSEEKKALLDEKELLYKHYGELTMLVKQLEDEKLGISSGNIPLGVKTKEAVKAQQKKLKTSAAEIEWLEKQIEQKRAFYEKQYGSSAGWFSWIKAPQKIVSSSAGVVAESLDKSVAWVNPFDSKGPSLEKKSLEELLELEMHLKEKINAQNNIVDALNQAFNEELAFQEQKRLLAELEGKEKIDVGQLRKSIKQIEKSIRSRYEEIQDGHERKKKLLNQLNEIFHQRQSSEVGWQKTGSTIAAPAKGFVGFWRAFLFGLPDKDVELTKRASSSSVLEDANVAYDIKKLKEDIELESLLIESKSREINQLEKQLEILRAKASLAGGFKFRSSFVKVPYAVIGEAIDSAKRLVPKKERQDLLIHQLDEKTKELQSLKEELKAVRQAISIKGGKTEAPEIVSIPPEARSEDKTVVEDETAAVSGQPASDQNRLKQQIQALVEELEVRRSVYEREKALLEAQWAILKVRSGSSKKAVIKSSEQLVAEGEGLKQEIQDVVDQIRELIAKEQELEKKESHILSKRITKIDLLVPRVNSKSASQDLLTERERLENRVTQLESRNHFLSKELERFQLPENPSTPR